MVRNQTFSTKEAARIFFGRTPRWLREQEERHGWNVAREDNRRMYTLDDIEIMVKYLLESQQIGVTRAKKVLRVVYALRALWASSK